MTLVAAALQSALAHHRAGRLPEAEASYRRILATQPADADAWHLLGVIAHQEGRHEAAVDLIARAVALQSRSPVFLNNLGAALTALGKAREAVPKLRRAAKLNPSYAEAHFNLGNALRECQRAKEAMESFRRAIVAKPDYAEAHYNLGLLLQDDRKLDEAAAAYERALVSRPDYADALANLGKVRMDQRRFADAVAAYDRALTVKPDFDEVLSGRVWGMLAMGDLARGWPEFDSRWRRTDVGRPRPFPQPWWEGQDLSGKTILVWGEQGIGDEITFASMIPDLATHGAHCVVECEARLLPLFARSFRNAEFLARSPDRPEARLYAADIDWQIPAGSLMRWLRPNVDAFPKKPGFLTVDPLCREYWRGRLDALGAGLTVGLSWKSGVMEGGRKAQFVPLPDWAPILKVPGVHFVNLQYGDCRADLDDVAALTSALDLVVTGPCAVVNIAGAVGTPSFHVWRHPEWELLGCDHRPFYPGERIFTTSWDRPWADLLGEVAVALAEEVKSR